MSRRARRAGGLAMARNVLLAVFLVSLVVALVPQRSDAAAAPGSAGTFTALPPTDSQVTVNGRGGFSGMSFTVNQTRNLVSQAVSINWTGGEPTKSSTSRFQENYVQVMQCWGDDDGTNAANPGPTPEQCVYGAADGLPDSILGGLFPASGQTVTRIISRKRWANYDPAVGTLDPQTGLVWRGFRSVDGSFVGRHTNPDYNPFQAGSNFWLNPLFNATTTNEVPGGRTGPNGEGSTLFRVDTGVESSGLGCGQRLVPAGGGAPRIPKCWIVIVPRGAASVENDGTPFDASADTAGVYTSPLAPEAWANRVAVPLDFNPVDSPCSINEDDRRLVGTELVQPAINSWQPTLCTKPGAPPYTYGVVSDAAARQQVVAPTSGSAGMAVTQAPLDAASTDPASPAVYAPLTLSGVVIGLNIQRNPLSVAEQAEQDLAGTQLATLNLTPRLVAKLLTQSYRSQVDINSEAAPYAWRVTNPDTLASDPDFLQFNPEFALLQITGGRSFSGLSLPARNSDLPKQVWNWILADPEAKAWLDGAPDRWGMVVNPVYATKASANENGVAFADPVPDSFPKSDPYCFESPARDTFQPPALCGTDWMPYLQGLREGAVATRSATDGAKVTENPFAVSPDQVWKRAAPQSIFRRSFLSLTDTVSASQYGIQTARLSRAGDNSSSREFIAPTTAALTKGVGGLVVKGEPTLREPDPTVDVPGGYPLTALTYAVIKPLALDATARSQYADFIDYAVSDGQKVGLEPGNLPLGYAPLPDSLKAQGAAAATTVRKLQAPPPPAQDTPSPTSGSSSSPTQTTPTRRTTPTTAPATSAEVAIAPVVETTASTPEAGPLTPILALARSRFFIPTLAGIGVLATLAALEITKRPRRGVKAGS